MAAVIDTVGAALVVVDTVTFTVPDVVEAPMLSKAMARSACTPPVDDENEYVYGAVVSDASSVAPS